MANLFYDRAPSRSARSLAMPSILQALQESTQAEAHFENHQGWSGSAHWVSLRKEFPEEIKSPYSAVLGDQTTANIWDFIIDFMEKLNALVPSTAKEHVISTYPPCKLEAVEHYADKDLQQRPMLMIKTEVMVQAESLGNVVSASAAAAVEWLAKYQGRWVMPLKEGDHLLYLVGEQAVGAVVIEHSETLFREEVSI